MAALGLLSAITGIFSLLPPTSQIITGIALVLIGAILTPFGYKFAKDTPPSAAKTAVDALRQAKLLDKTHKS
jgi:ABC-type uncharacterized transport system permease subunit